MLRNFAIEKKEEIAASAEYQELRESKAVRNVF